MQVTLYATDTLGTTHAREVPDDEVCGWVQLYTGRGFTVRLSSGRVLTP